MPDLTSDQLAEQNKLYARYIELLQKVNNLTAQQAKLKADASKAAGDLNKEVERLEDIETELLNKASYLFDTFRETTAELKNQNLILDAGKSVFKSLTSLAEDFNYQQRGISDLSERDLKRSAEKIAQSQVELKNVRSKLSLDGITYNRQADLNRLIDLQKKDGVKLSKAQENLLDQLTKEKALLDSANNALEEGIPLLNEELKISKQIYKTRTDLSGVAGAAASILEKFGGNLAQFLDVSEAREEVDKFNKKLIDDALKSESVLKQIQQIEQQRIDVLNSSLSIQEELADIQKQINDAIEAGNQARLLGNQLTEIQRKIQSGEAADRAEYMQLIQDEEDLKKKINNLNLKHNQLSDLESKQQQKKQDLLNNEKKIEQDLLNLDKKEADIKTAAIASVNTLGNKFKALGVFIKESAGGITKLFSDPVVLMTTLIENGFKANKQVVELGKSFGLSAKAAEDIRQEVAQFSRETGDTFINTDRLLKAQAELSQEMGMAVKFSNEELATFAKLTELTGLTAQEAGKLAGAAAAAGVSTEAYTDGIREGAFAAMQATDTHFSMKEVMQDISKLSAGTLIKFQGNPKALAATVVEAKKLGLSLEQVNKTGESLLNFESSIESELKAELMTGKQLNLERARAAALSNDQAALTKEIGEQVGTLNDYQNMNVLAQQSLAEAFGMSRDEMSEMLMKQEAVNQYGEEAAQLNKEQLDEMKRRNMSAAEYIQYQEQQRSAQDKFADAMTKLQDLIGNLVAGPVGQLLDALANMVGVAMKILSVFSPIFNVIAFIAEAVSDLLSNWYILYPLIGLVALGYLPKMLAGFSGILGSVGNIGKGIKDAFSGDGIKGFTDKIKGVFTGGKSKGKELAEKVTETSPEDLTDKAESSSGKADKIGKGGGGKSFKAKMKDIAAGLKEFADVKVLLGALNLIPSSLGLTAMIPGAIGAKILDTIDGKKVKEALKGIASGLVEFGKNNIILGSLNLLLASAGLTAMIPGAIGAKIISSIDGKKLKESLKAISGGIESFGNASLVLGALNMVVAAVGLTAMIPGAIGAKIISQIDSKKFQKSMEGLAAGIESFGKGNVALGAGNMVIASIGLVAMIPGAIGAKLISQIDSKKFQKSMEGISAGIQSFGKGNVVLGSLNLVLASVGLVAMIPGVIATKVIESINSKKLKDNLSSLAEGISSLGTGKVLLGTLALPLIAVGLIAMIPGVLGAKIIEQINGKKLKYSLTSLAEGISSMGTGNVLLGSLALITASLGLIAMIPGVAGAKLIELIDGKKFKSALGGIADGIAAFGKSVSIGDLAKLLFGGIALTAFAVGVPALLLLQLVNGSLIEKTLTGVGKGIKGFSENVSYKDLIKGAIAIALFGASLIPFAYALNMLAEVKMENILAAAAGLVIFGAAVFGLGALMMGPGAFIFGAGILALIALGGAMMILGQGLKVVSEGGAGMAQLFQQLSELDATKLDAIAPALKTIGEAIMYLGAGGVLSALGNLLGGDSPSKMIQDIAASADGITKAASGLQLMASSITQLASALNSLDVSKLQDIEKLSGVKEEGFFDKLINKTPLGLIKSAGEKIFGGGESTTSPSALPVTSVISSTGVSSTKSESIQPGNIDLTPMINAIKEVKASVDRLYGKDTSINMDGTKVGTTLTQGSYRVA